MRVFITGIAGFIGSHLADALIEQGHKVWGIDNYSTGRRENLAHQFGEPVEGDIRDIFDFPERPFDVIYHCAASYKDRAEWERDASTNVLGTLNVIRVAQRTGARIVYFQTSLCYGLKPNSPVFPDAPLNPTGSYAVSKTAGERYIADSGVEYVSLRLANIYGPRNLSGPIPAFYQRLSKDEPCTVVDSRRDFVYIDDLVSVAVKAATQGRGVYHVSTGQDKSIKQMYRAVQNAMGIDFLADDNVTYVERGPDDAATILLNPDETYVEYGWKANTPLVHGITEAVRWYKANPVTETFTHLAPVEAK